jgi:hypothetical protein
MKSIEIGQTTRKDVLFALGEPAIARRDGDLFAYSDFQLKTQMHFLLASPRGGAAGGSVGFGTKHLLAITFDNNGIVRTVELSAESAREGITGLPKTTYCISSGECFVSDGRDIVAFATPGEDREAKSFAATPNSCVVYLYPDDEFDYSVVLDTRVRLPSTNRGYFLWRLDPGQHRIAASTPQPLTDAELTFSCEAGEAIFLRYFYLGVFQGMKLAHVPAVEGEAGVRSGKLVLGDL